MLLGVVGNPISHTRSPLIQSLFAREAKLNMDYVAIQAADPAEVHRLLEATQTVSRCRGFNLTIPFKEVLLSYHPDSLTIRIGAGNTVVKRNNRWESTNTDWQGFLAPLSGRTLRTACVLGWGGSARAVVYALQSVGCQVTVISRRDCQIPGIQVIQSDYESPLMGFSTPDLIVNTTPVGMAGTGSTFRDEFLRTLGKPVLAYDLIYRPAVTPFLKHFRSVGSETVNGAPMLVGQAAAAFYHWFGIQPSVEVCQQAISDLIDG